MTGENAQTFHFICMRGRKKRRGDLVITFCFCETTAGHWIAARFFRNCDTNSGESKKHFNLPRKCRIITESSYTVSLTDDASRSVETIKIRITCHRMSEYNCTTQTYEIRRVYLESYVRDREKERKKESKSLRPRVAGHLVT